jgi:hypothetical protein
VHLKAPWEGKSGIRKNPPSPHLQTTSLPRNLCASLWDAKPLTLQFRPHLGSTMVEMLPGRVKIPLMNSFAPSGHLCNKQEIQRSHLNVTWSSPS